MYIVKTDSLRRLRFAFLSTINMILPINNSQLIWIRKVQNCIFQITYNAIKVGAYCFLEPALTTAMGFRTSRGKRTPMEIQLTLKYCISKKWRLKLSSFLEHETQNTRGITILDFNVFTTRSVRGLRFS